MGAGDIAPRWRSGSYWTRRRRSGEPRATERHAALRAGQPPSSVSNSRRVRRHGLRPGAAGAPLANRSIFRQSGIWMACGGVGGARHRSAPNVTSLDAGTPHSVVSRGASAAPGLPPWAASRAASRQVPPGADGRPMEAVELPPVGMSWARRGCPRWARHQSKGPVAAGADAARPSSSAGARGAGPRPAPGPRPAGGEPAAAGRRAGGQRQRPRAERPRMGLERLGNGPGRWARAAPSRRRAAAARGAAGAAGARRQQRSTKRRRGEAAAAAARRVAAAAPGRCGPARAPSTSRAARPAVDPLDAPAGGRTGAVPQIGRPAHQAACGGSRSRTCSTRSETSDAEAATSHGFRWVEPPGGGEARSRGRYCVQAARRGGAAAA